MRRHSIRPSSISPCQRDTSSSMPDAESTVPRTTPLRVALVSLGCPKNLVDSERMLGLLHQAGIELAADPETADCVVVNTCAFIRDAQEEAIDAVLEMAARKRAGRLRGLIVAGCLPQRHGRALLEEIPEIDALIGPGRLADIVRAAESLGGAGPRPVALDGFPCVDPAAPRERIGAPHSAYLKIAEGCDHRCRFCLIPRLRGPQRSRALAAIERELLQLAEEGVREVTLVAQDTSAYGRDLSPRHSLAGLLQRLRRRGGPDWIRVLYTHPAHWSEELIAVFAEGRPLLPYIDLPVQHVSAAVLRAMGRGGRASELRNLLERLRRRIPGAVLRTTVMTGHPGEGAAEFQELLGFIRQFPFDRLGAFAYSPEDGTRSAKVPSRVSAAEARRRRDLVLAQQREISRELQLRRRGSRVDLLIDGVAPQRHLWVGRSYGEAPEIDGMIYVKAAGPEWGAEPGEMRPVRIVAAGPYDLIARPVAAGGGEG
ncbi:MAG: 30S ribosomal protein S12 methylthiotransferase RimO [Candidatus Eisenbacteria bacterium]|nr:30S ribosomal protein S12 methylthiotransferase RimO [Candidatus Eisenbacteria bacterium]